MLTINSLEHLEKIYGIPNPLSISKVSKKVTPEYAALIKASSFLAIATSGSDGLDCSPRGDSGQVLFIGDDKTLYLPDRRGNNRVDTLANIIHDPRVALMMLIPGLNHSLRINGTAVLTLDPELLERFTVARKAPKCVVTINVDEVYFQCGRAVMRAGLWDREKHHAKNCLPTAGDILQTMTNEVNGQEYDTDWDGRAKKSLW